MTASHAELSAPLVLLAMPQIQDPFFHRSVILLVHHDAEGSLGFIVNRRTGSPVREMLKEMGIEWKGKPDLAVYFGGPVHPHLGTVLYDVSVAGTADAGPGDSIIPGLPGLRLTRSITDLTQIAARPPDLFRLFLGYAGWGPGQLLQEILRNDWLTAPPRQEILFSPEPDGVWTHALGAVGVNPDALPTWAPGGQGPVA
ncbi:MAG TPA: YqgE/AlgH family protein [Candidatus Polarisedimenticolia bacterium]|jgi:putative transcriptional regulator|nr:YqgE/AlgH family protein [Candidatus Polarisedimenticolia bacterium]